MSITAALPVGCPTSWAGLLRHIARGGLAALMTGVLLGGVGGRLAMRLSALIDPASRGKMTAGGAVVGEFTLSGTLGLIVFAGLGTGVLLAFLWVIVRPWLPNRGLYRYLTAGVVSVAMGAHFAIEGRNIDFLILDPKFAQVAIFMLLALLTGLAVVAVDGFLERRLPAAAGAARGWYGLVALLGLLLAVPASRLLFSVDSCDCASPPRLPGALLILTGAFTAAAWMTGIQRGAVPGWIRIGGRGGAVAMVLAGLLHLGGEVAHFA